MHLALQFITSLQCKCNPICYQICYGNFSFCQYAGKLSLLFCRSSKHVQRVHIATEQRSVVCRLAFVDVVAVLVVVVVGIRD